MYAIRSYYELEVAARSVGVAAGRIELAFRREDLSTALTRQRELRVTQVQVADRVHAVALAEHEVRRDLSRNNFV